MQNNENAQVTAKLMKARISPKKVNPVVELIRGKNIKEAKIALTFDKTKAAQLILKVLKSAEANAVNNAKLSAEKLYVHEVWVGPGPTIKSGQFVARGRFNPILKRTSHIYVGVSERTK